IMNGGDVQEVAIAVLGSAGVGKSTFIQCALEQEHAGTPPVSSKRLSWEGFPAVVHLVEIDVRDVRVDDNSLQWPDTIEDRILPAIDGALLLYDVVDPSSIVPIAELLSESARPIPAEAFQNSKCS
ncbi:MAG: hypothetical protein Q9163_004377, partial [Psora crenata]